MKICVVPEPKKIIFNGKLLKFNGIKNIPEFLRKEFKILKGDFIIERINKKGTGLEINNKTIKIWGDQNISLATLCQLIKQNSTYLPEVYIEEEFKFSFRGYHLDLGRGGIPNLDYFKKILRLLFLFKYNYFAIYFEDLFPFKKYPQIGENRGRLTENELKQIIEYGMKLGIEVFPSLELAGHMENILTIPEFSKYSEWHRPQEGCLDISNLDARKFAYDLLDEVIGFFKSASYIHIGGDETWALGRGKSLNKTLKFCGPQLYEIHHKNMIDTVIKNKKVPILWGDMLTGMYLNKEEKNIWKKLLKSKIWDKVIIANWDYSKNDQEYFNNKIKLFNNKQQIVCPGFSNWGRFYPDFNTAIKNLKNFLNAAKNNNVMGFLATSWGDDNAECLYSFTEILILATSEIAEGKGNWEDKWLCFSKEERNIFDIRLNLGRFDIGYKIKDVMFRDMQLTKKTYFCWLELNKKMERVELPADLRFIHNMLKSGLKKLNNKLKFYDLLNLCKEYTQLWLKERKIENLNKVLYKIKGVNLFYDYRN